MIKDNLSDNEFKVKKVLKVISCKKNNEFVLIKRPNDVQKDPKKYMIEMGIGFNDVVKLIKGLTKEDFLEIIPDTKNNYIFLYVFEKIIESNNTYIKIGFEYNDFTNDVRIVSFHKSIKGGN